MNTYTSTVTNYNGDRDVVTKGLTLEQAVLKVQRNIYGYYQDEKYIIKTINSRAESELGATMFCAQDTAQVNIKKECK